MNGAFMAQGGANRLARMPIPHPCGAVLRRGDHKAAIRIEAGGNDIRLVAHRFSDGLARAHVPNPGVELLVSRGAASGDDAVAVRTEAGRIHSAFLFQGMPDRLARMCIPEARSFVERSCDDPCAVGIEIGGIDFIVVAHGITDRLAGLRVPQTRGAVVGRGGDSRAVGTEAGCVDGSIVAQRIADGLAGKLRPNARGFILRCRDDLFAIRAEAGGEDFIVVAQGWRGGQGPGMLADQQRIKTDQCRVIIGIAPHRPGQGGEGFAFLLCRTSSTPHQRSDWLSVWVAFCAFNQP